MSAVSNILEGDRSILALIGANGVLASVRKFFVSHQPELTAFLTVLQIVVALITILHFARKYWVKWVQKRIEPS